MREHGQLGDLLAMANSRASWWRQLFTKPGPDGRPAVVDIDPKRRRVRATAPPRRCRGNCIGSIMAVTDEAIGKIRELIRSGGLKPGDRLPPEKELSHSLGLSRNSLREAVKALEMINVLDVRRGDGTYVTNLRPNSAMDAMSFVLELQRDETILDLLEVRRVLEAAAGAKAAARITAVEVAQLRELSSQVGAHSGVEELVANDLAFHHRIAAIGGNEFLCDLLDVVAGRTSRVRVWRGITQQGAIERTLGEHAAILAALELHDPALAAGRLTAHVSGVEDWVRRALLEQDSLADE